MERLPDAELEVMQALWRQEKYPVSSAALMEELAGRRWQTATLLKLLYDPALVEGYVEYTGAIQKDGMLWATSPKRCPRSRGS